MSGLLWIRVREIPADPSIDMASQSCRNNRKGDHSGANREGGTTKDRAGRECRPCLSLSRKMLPWPAPREVRTAGYTRAAGQFHAAGQIALSDRKNLSFLVRQPSFRWKMGMSGEGCRGVLPTAFCTGEQQLSTTPSGIIINKMVMQIRGVNRIKYLPN